MALIADIIEGASLSEDADGYEATRVYLVTELGGAAHNRLYLAGQTNGLPRFGDPHPSIPRLRCVQRAITLAKGSDNNAQVTLTYRVPKAQETPAGGGGSGGAPAPGVVRIGSTVQSKITQKDKSGNAITVTHKFPNTKAIDEEFRGLTKTQGVDVDIQAPNLVLSETRNEARSPAALARAYVGTVNQFAIWGGAARTYLCTRIDGQTSDGGKTFEVSYEFQYEVQTWDAPVVFRDPKTQRPVDNLVAGEGLKIVRVYAEANFALLGLSL